MKAVFTFIGALALSAALTAALVGQAPPVNVTTATILKPAADSWPTYNGDYSGRRFSPLTRITAANAKHLSLAWAVDTPGGQIKATPLIVNGVAYISTPDHAFAIDARTGRELWHYTWLRNRGGIHIGNRGVALFRDTLYFVTPDCNLVALEAATGKEKWFTEICSLEMVYYASIAPVVVKDMLILGVSGDDLDQPGYLDARSPVDGKLIWRWYVTPQKEGDPGLETWPNLDMARHGGGMIWQPVTYDPEANLIYATTGNPQPVIAHKNRPGANLFTASIVALNADTGKMAWYFQSSPRDSHDLDSTQTAVLFDVPGRGRFVAQAARNGKFFVLDRLTGKAVVSAEYIKTLQFLGYDERGQPVPNPKKDPTPDGNISTGSATNWYPPAYSPQTQLFYVNAARPIGIYYVYDTSDNPMGWGGGGGGGGAAGEEPSIKAIDIRTGEIRWATPKHGGGNGGLVVTAGNVLFGSGSGGIAAYNATTGAPLWASRIGNISNGIITYLLDGKQYVLASAGARLHAFVLNE